jgi:hypothetical protein
MWNQSHPEETKKASKKFYKENIVKLRERSWARQGITMTFEKFNELLSLQDNKCGICEAHSSQFKKSFHVDHNHETGKIRGLLCTNCNTAIGLLNENPILFTKATEWIS